MLVDLRALATVPGLDRLAAVLAAHDPGGTHSDYLSLAIYLAIRWRVGSSRELDSLLADPVVPLWNMVRMAADEGARRRLSPRPSTYDMLHGYRQRVMRRGRGAFEAMLRDVQTAFTEIAVELAKSLGLLQPGAWDLDSIDRGNVIAVDGTFFKPATGVVEHEDGTVSGSRADATNPAGRGPRAVEVRKYKKNNRSVPVAMATVRDDAWNHRVVLGVTEILEGSEHEAGHALIGRTVDAAGADSVHAVVYDRLFQGADISQVLHRRVLPVVPMQAPDERSPYQWPITEKQAQQRYAVPLSRRKSAVKAYELEHVIHDGCVHQVWAIDGSVTIVPATEVPSVECPPSHLTDIRWEPNRDGYAAYGRYEYSCGGRSHGLELPLTGSAPRLTGKTEDAGNAYRPIPDTDPRFARLIGYRQDIESTYATIKRPLHLEGRAISYDPDHFTLDAIGGALLVNAVAWDIHGPRKGVA